MCPLKIAAAAAPATAEELENELVRRRVARGRFHLETVFTTARAFGRNPRFRIEMLDGHRVAVPSANKDLLKQIYEMATSLVRRLGVATVEDLAAATKTASSV